jgi:hypothetical protein
MSAERRENVVLTPVQVDELRGVLNGCYSALNGLYRLYGVGLDYPTDAVDAYEELGEYMYPSDGDPVLPTCGEKLEAWLDAGPPQPITVDAKARIARRRLTAGGGV